MGLRLCSSVPAGGLRVGNQPVSRIYLGAALVYDASGGVIPDVAPSLVSAPYISGTPTEGEALSSNRGVWAGTAPITFDRQWLRNGTAISGATGTTYVLVSADVGKAISLRVTATNVAGSVNALAEATAAVVAANPTPGPALPIGVVSGLLHGLPLALAA